MFNCARVSTNSYDSLKIYLHFYRYGQNNLQRIQAVMRQTKRTPEFETLFLPLLTQLFGNERVISSKFLLLFITENSDYY